MATATAQQQEQYDVLWLTTEGNPLIPASPVPTINKSLATNAKQIIKAINEVLKDNQLTQASLDSFINNFNTFVALIGDTYADSTLSPKLTNIAGNIILALDTLSKAIEGLDDTIAKKADSSVTDSISKSISDINISLSTLSNSIQNVTSGGGSVAQQIFNLGSCNLPYSTTSIYDDVAFLPLSADIQSKIDFSKPPRIQIFASCSGNYYGATKTSKSFKALIYDSFYFDPKRFRIGYTPDKVFLAIMVCSSADSMSAAQINLIIE